MFTVLPKPRRRRQLGDHERRAGVRARPRLARPRPDDRAVAGDRRAASSSPTVVWLGACGGRARSSPLPEHDAGLALLGHRLHAAAAVVCRSAIAHGLDLRLPRPRLQHRQAVQVANPPRAAFAGRCCSTNTSRLRLHRARPEFSCAEPRGSPEQPIHSASVRRLRWRSARTRRSRRRRIVPTGAALAHRPRDRRGSSPPTSAARACAWRRLTPSRRTARGRSACDGSRSCLRRSRRAWRRATGARPDTR